ncbi:hypothetical protein ACFWZ2_08705 [Streptomyces sp. NPDC059002]|uniref:hypothetical protein n=1 Tax=Streptomyces sp. NPDC059002 TaxID=3346690 RepID=UPI00368D9DF6
MRVRTRAFWKYRLLWPALSVLLLALVQCAGEPAHAAQRPTARAAAVSAPLPPLEARLASSAEAGRETPDDCSPCDSGRSGAAATVRALPHAAPTATTTSSVGPLNADRSGAVRSRTPEGGRTTLAALFRWLL